MSFPVYVFVFSEFMCGGSMFDLLHKQKQSFNLQALLRVAIDVSKGMNYLHHNNIIHRDLKTANLLMDENRVRNLFFAVLYFSVYLGFPFSCSPEFWIWWVYLPSQVTINFVLESKDTIQITDKWYVHLFWCPQTAH